MKTCGTSSGDYSLMSVMSISSSSLLVMDDQDSYMQDFSRGHLECLFVKIRLSVQS